METASKTPKRQDRAEVVLFPPLVGLILALLGIGLHAVYPARIIESKLTLAVGLLILAAGIVLQVVCIRAFKKFKTTPLFKKPTTRILQSGPYKISRNPIYIAVLMQFLGLAVLINSLWLLVLMPVLFLYLQFGVIVYEERYLEQKFGTEYRTYKSNVPRWL